MSSSRRRQPRAEDAEAVASLFVSTYGDFRPTDAEEIRTWLENEEIRPEWRLVLEDESGVVGYGDIWIEDDELALDAAAPGRWDTFLDWAEREARAAAVGRVRVWLPEGHELEAVVGRRGYRYWRSSFTMEIDLPARPAPPPLPDGFELRDYREADAEPLRDLLNHSFARDPFWHEVTPGNFREFYLRARGFDPELWLLASTGGELAGASLCYLQHGSDESLGWVGTLAVRERSRGRGLGGALLRWSFLRLYDRGLRRVGLGVDAENVTGALRLYETAGMRRVSRGDNWILEL